MRSFARVLVAALLTVATLALIAACSSASSSSSDAAIDGAQLSCSSVCAAKATTCGVSSTAAASDCQTICGAHPSQAELACAQQSSCTALQTAFVTGKLVCSDAGTKDGMADTMLPGPPDGGPEHTATDGEAADAPKHDASHADAERHDGSEPDATMHDGGGDATMHDGGADATMHDAGSSDSGMDGGQDSGQDSGKDSGQDAGTCMATVAGSQYSCTALASYSPSAGLLFSIEVSATVFQFTGTIATSNNFTTGQGYTDPVGNAVHDDDSGGVWIYSNISGDGTASIDVMSPGTALMDDGGTGDIYFSGAYGDAMFSLAPKDPPYATGEVQVTVHWVTEIVGHPIQDGGTQDGSMHDAAPHDGSTDASADAMDAGGDDSGADASGCALSMSGGLTTPDGGIPCTAQLIDFPAEPFTSFYVSAMSGADFPQVSVAFPSDPSGLGGQRTSASLCSSASYCGASASVTMSIDGGSNSWARSWQTSDEGSSTPWFDFELPAYGACPPGPGGADTCNSYLVNYTATIPSTVDGGVPVVIKVTAF